MGAQDEGRKLVIDGNQAWRLVGMTPATCPAVMQEQCRERCSGPQGRPPTHHLALSNALTAHFIRYVFKFISILASEQRFLSNPFSWHPVRSKPVELFDGSHGRILSLVRAIKGVKIGDLRP